MQNNTKKSFFISLLIKGYWGWSLHVLVEKPRRRFADISCISVTKEAEKTEAKSGVYLFFTLFLKLNCSIGISPMEKSGCFPRAKPAATESRYPTYGACWVFQRFHNPPNSDMDYRIFNVHADVSDVCDLHTGVYGQTWKLYCTESWFWEINSLPHRGNEPASAACRSDTLPTELHPHPKRGIAIISHMGRRVYLFIHLYYI